MRNVLLTAHVLAAIVLIGPVTAASSRFAVHVRRRQIAEAAAANRTTRAYGWISLVVAALGVLLALRSDAFGQIWVDTSLVLFALAAAMLLAVHLPAQQRALDLLWENADVGQPLVARLRLSAGGYALLWVAVLWLMIAKPT
jgi:drug/metabolite transporter (DMT)-like permease